MTVVKDAHFALYVTTLEILVHVHAVRDRRCFYTSSLLGFLQDQKWLVRSDLRVVAQILPKRLGVVWTILIGSDILPNRLSWLNTTIHPFLSIAAVTGPSNS